jgi:hypothetical protein
VNNRTEFKPIYQEFINESAMIYKRAVFDTAGNGQKNVETPDIGRKIKPTIYF